MPSEKGRYLKDQRPKKVLGDYGDERAALFDDLADEEDDTLMDLLERSYDAMTPPQRRDVFGDRLDRLRIEAFDGQHLLREVEKFREESLAGEFYAPFDINSKNLTHVPAETEEWFNRLADFLKAATALVAIGDYHSAVNAFDVLYELIDAMKSGDEIVFGDEIGSWMIPIREEECVAAYLKAVAQIENPVGFANAAIEMLRRDRSQSFALKVYPSALDCGSPEQIAAFEAKIQKLGLPTKGNW
jgi:hypothetical protein